MRIMATDMGAVARLFEEQRPDRVYHLAAEVGGIGAHRDNPGRHPGLLVRVSGYSAYFDDLAPEVKDELIARFTDAGGAPGTRAT